LPQLLLWEVKIGEDILINSWAITM